MAVDQNARLVLIASLAERTHFKPLGRTALVKLCYFLQTLRSVPVGYRFTLYSYGPFDSDVLADLQTAESLGLVTCDFVTYPGGYGYEIRTGKQARRARVLACDFLKRYSSDIEWVLAEFGSYNASDLELLSTIIFVDREVGRTADKLNVAQVVRRVKDVKPHFVESYIEEKVRHLQTKRLLANVDAVPAKRVH